MSLRPNARTEVRRSQYKVAVDAEQGRSRREDTMVEIRKNLREESLQKKRRDGLSLEQQLSLSDPPASGFDMNIESISSINAGVYSDDPAIQLKSTAQLRKLLSREYNTPIEEVVQAGVVPCLVQFLGREDFPQLQLEAAWALTNIASGTSENTRMVIDHGAVPYFVKLLGSPIDDIREQAVWALGNIAGDSPKCRDLVLQSGAMISLLTQFNEHAKLSILRNATWTLSNFCRGKPQPSFDQIRLALPILASLIQLNDEEILTDACWALSYLSDGTNDKIESVIQAGVCPRLVKLLLQQSPSVLIPALRTVGNIVTGDDIQTQHTSFSPVHQYMILQLCGDLCFCLPGPGALATLTPFVMRAANSVFLGLDFGECQIILVKALRLIIRPTSIALPSEFNIKKEACWTISNITAGNRDQIQEAACAFSNATCGGSHEQIKFLVGQGCINPLCDLLVCPDPRIITVCLQALGNILKVGESEKTLGRTGDVNLYAQLIEGADGLEKMESLQSHDNNDIYDKAVNFLETYCMEEEEDDLAAAVDGASHSEDRIQFAGNEPPVPPGGFTLQIRA
ncbi:hypothetical protein V2J09_009295 [Rumex salicifolius]